MNSRSREKSQPFKARPSCWTGQKSLGLIHCVTLLRYSRKAAQHATRTVLPASLQLFWFRSNYKNTYRTGNSSISRTCTLGVTKSKRFCGISLSIKQRFNPAKKEKRFGVMGTLIIEIPFFNHASGKMSRAFGSLSTYWNLKSSYEKFHERKKNHLSIVF